MRYLPLAFLLALLSGCATPEERASRALDRYGPYCDKIGYQRETDAWRDCVASQARSAAARRAIVSTPTTCTTVGSTTTCN